MSHGGQPLRVLGISGSLQARSSNAAVLRAAARLAPTGMELVLFDGLAVVPPLDVDLDGEHSATPTPVHALRAAVGTAEGLLIVSPEYAHSVPGVLKNALDWLVASGELAALPVALIGASSTHTGAIRGQLALIQTLLAQSAQIASTLTIPSIKGKLDDDGELGDRAALRRVSETLVALDEAIRERRDWLAA
ncbi:MAG TPA: NADPH-dependent FMN reductase [Solirubrobacteraceae bacterium]|nr:NADPH-dependent FMN reductase [Solirubrobacteraceae bacterium]